MKLRHAPLVSIVLVSGIASSLGQDSPKRVKILEAYPQSIKARIDERARKLTRPATFPGNKLFSFIKTTSCWQPGHTVTVAFRGGDPVLYTNIVSTASLWISTNVNLHLDFGPDADKGIYRIWSTADTKFTADIRVAFDQAGYWSLIGTEASDRTLNVKPNETSLNLERFDSYLPPDWAAVVLHEFGHALGFLHEHQNPRNDCEAEFRWQDDPGYLATTNQYGEYIPYYDNAAKLLCPGVYTVLGGPPNGWDKDKVDENMRHIPNSSAYAIEAFDKKSIMMYTFDAWMYIKLGASSCFTPENTELSNADRKGIADTYPMAQNDVTTILSQQIKQIGALLNSENLDGDLKLRYRAKLDSLQ